jgi:plasmid replication initiation protein
MAKLIQTNGNLEVKKSEAIVKARYKLSPLAIKFISVIISNLKRSDDINEEYILKVKDFRELTGQKTKRIYELIDEALNDLLKNPLTIPLGDEKNSILKANWVSGAVYNEGEVKFMIYPKLRPFLLEVKEKFLKYKLENILPLKSSYVIRLYEILKDWLELNSRYGNKAEKIISLDEFREILEIPKSYQYGNSSGIKRRILEKAKTELEKHTDILFEYEEIKSGRKVTHLKFIIKPNPAKLQTDNRIQDNYFKSRKTFVALLRRNYSGNGKFWGFKTIDGATYWLGLDNNGLLYATSGKDIKDFNGVESAEIYDFWLKVAQNCPLYQELISEGICLKDLALNNKEIWLEFREDLISLKEAGII